MPPPASPRHSRPARVASAALLMALALAGSACNERAEGPAAPPAVEAAAGSGPGPAPAPAPSPAPPPTVAGEALPPAADTAAAALAASGQAGTVTCDLIIRAKSLQGDALLFQLSLWCPEDGRVRVRASKLDFDFIDAVVERDGSFVLELVRSHEVVRGTLGDINVLDAKGHPSGPPFLAYLLLLVSEAKNGALPPRGPYRAVPPPPGSPPHTRTLLAKDPVSGLETETTLGPDDNPLSKRILDAPGTEALRLDYARIEHFHNLVRATKLKLSIPGDDSEYTVRLRTLDAVPAISEERMHFTPSPGDKEISVGEFLKRLNE